MLNKIQKIISTAKENIRYIMNINNGFEVTEYIISSAILPKEFENFKIVHLSDIHGAHFGDGNHYLIEAVMEEHPDIIVITGDLVKAIDDIPEMTELCRNLTEICNVYFCSGNHEFMSRAYEKLITELVANGVYVIDNERMAITKGNAKIYIAGLKDPLAYSKKNRRAKFKQAMNDTNTSTNEFSILLSHRPNFFKPYATTNHNFFICFLSDIQQDASIPLCVVHRKQIWETLLLHTYCP